jgi:hypothetical protein
MLVLNDGEFKNQVAVIVGEAPSALREIDGGVGPTLDWEQKRLQWDTHRSLSIRELAYYFPFRSDAHGRGLPAGRVADPSTA